MLRPQYGPVHKNLVNIFWLNMFSNRHELRRPAYEISQIIHNDYAHRLGQIDIYTEIITLAPSGRSKTKNPGP